MERMGGKETAQVQNVCMCAILSERVYSIFGSTQIVGPTGKKNVCFVSFRFGKKKHRTQ